MTTKNYGDLVETKEWSDYEARQGRKGHPDEIGDVVVLLSTPRMSLVNGHNLVIDGYVGSAQRRVMFADEWQRIHYQRKQQLIYPCQHRHAARMDLALADEEVDSMFFPQRG